MSVNCLISFQLPFEKTRSWPTPYWLGCHYNSCTFRISVAYYICRLCLLLFSNLLRVSEVFIPRQKQHQLTWQAELKDSGGGPRVYSCTHHSAVQLDPWPVGPSSSLHRLYVSCHCHPLLSSPGQGTATQKAQSVIKSKGHRGQQRPKSRGWSCAHPGMTPPVMSATSCTPVEIHREREKGRERDLHWLALHFRSSDISFVLSPDRPRLNSCTGVRQGVRRLWGSPFPDGSWKDCQCRVHIKMDRPQPCLMRPMTSLKP